MISRSLWVFRGYIPACLSGGLLYWSGRRWVGVWASSGRGRGKGGGGGGGGGSMIELIRQNGDWKVRNKGKGH